MLDLKWMLYSLPKEYHYLLKLGFEQAQLDPQEGTALTNFLLRKVPDNTIQYLESEIPLFKDFFNAWFEHIKTRYADHRVNPAALSEARIFHDLISSKQHAVLNKILSRCS